MTTNANNYRSMGYWFASGHWFAQPREAWAPDFSSDFGHYCRRRRIDYDQGGVTHLPSIPDMWNEYLALLKEFA